MVRHTGQKKRGKVSKSRKKILLIGTEGKNKTEKNYFSHFNRMPENDYVIRFSTGNNTDPEGIVDNTVDTVKKEELNFKDGDLAFCVFDTDTGDEKQKQIDAAVIKASKKNVEIILSNPCFEIWFLQHFGYSTKEYKSNGEVLRTLEGFIPEYEKNSDPFVILNPLTAEAIRNSKKLEKYHDDLGHRSKSMERNPSTEVYKIIEKII